MELPEYIFKNSHNTTGIVLFQDYAGPLITLLIWLCCTLLMNIYYVTRTFVIFLVSLTSMMS